MKQKRMDANNLSAKIEVLGAYSDVLAEKKRIDTLLREQFNRKKDLLHLTGVPAGADKVEFEDQVGRFGLDDFDMGGMIRVLCPSKRKEATCPTESF